MYVAGANGMQNIEEVLRCNQRQGDFAEESVGNGSRFLD